jgi:hypothetical protein
MGMSRRSAMERYTTAREMGMPWREAITSLMQLLRAL